MKSNSIQQYKKYFKYGGQYPHPSFCPTGLKFWNNYGKQGQTWIVCPFNTHSVEPYSCQNLINQVTHSPLNSNETLSHSVYLSFVNNDSDDNVHHKSSLILTRNISFKAQKKSYITTVKTSTTFSGHSASVNIINLKAFKTIDKLGTIIKIYRDDNLTFEVLGKLETLIESKKKITRTWFFFVNTE